MTNKLTLPTTKADPNLIDFNLARTATLRPCSAPYPDLTAMPMAVRTKKLPCRLVRLPQASGFCNPNGSVRHEHLPL